MISAISVKPPRQRAPDWKTAPRNHFLKRQNRKVKSTGREKAPQTPPNPPQSRQESAPNEWAGLTQWGRSQR